MKHEGISRRHLLKSAAAGALTLSSIPTIIVPRRAEAYQPGGQIHPHIHPLRVVGVQESGMTTQQAVVPGWTRQDKLVAADAVAENMDRMAMALSEESSAADAWKKIFLKPAGKGWGDVVVAVKTNQIAQQRTRSAVMSKLCHVLTDVVGVKGSNIHIYDACHGSGMSTRNPFAGLPEGVHLADRWGGYDTPTAVPAPYRDGTEQSRCLGHLVRGEVDILVDVALCKGHGRQFGAMTMCMKNHFGTFNPKPAHGEGGGADYLIGINKTPQILGRMEPRTGSVLFPRQQLCVVDALWASRPGPGGPVTHQPNVLLMGTFAPGVDYVGAMGLRRDVLKWPVNEQVVGRFLTEFGFSEDELPGEERIVDALAWVA